MTGQHDYRAWVQAVQLRRIGLISAMVERKGNPSSEGARLIAEMSIGPAHRYNHPELEYRFTFDFEITEDDNTIAHVSAAYSCLYDVDLPHSDGKYLESFAQDVVVMNVFPYARELVQNLAARVDLPGVTVGLIKRGQIGIGVAEEISLSDQ